MKIKEEVNKNWFKDGHKLINEKKSNKIDNLFKLYAKDKYVARVIYMNDNSNYEHFRTILFTKENGDFTIVVFRKKYGISKTNVMYNHEKRIVEVIYKGGKFYLVDNTTKVRSGITTLTLRTLANACSRVSIYQNNYTWLYDTITSVLENRFSWIRFLKETDLCNNVAFNTIISNKIYNQKKALTHEYKTTEPVAKLLHKLLHSHDSHAHNLVKAIEGYMPYIKNIESLQEDWFMNKNIGIFHDTLKMGKILNKQVNASWTARRLKEEHDKWAKIISDIVFIDGNRDMNINKIYKDFSEHSGYELITTTRDMAYEGKRQNHCVATYVNRVEDGTCAIITTKEYTVELRTKYFGVTRVISISQVKGYGNSEPTKTFLYELDYKVLEYNKTLTDGKFEYKDLNAHPTSFGVDDILQF